MASSSPIFAPGQSVKAIGVTKRKAPNPGANAQRAGSPPTPPSLEQCDRHAWPEDYCGFS
jgi:hypothetical protein